MTFEEILDQAVAMLQRRGRMTYRALQAQFQLDEGLVHECRAGVDIHHKTFQDVDIVNDPFQR